MYPDFLKRLDDNSDEVRVAAARAFQAHFGCFDDFQVSLYRAHLESIYQGLLVHLDDQEATIQQAILGMLSHSNMSIIFIQNHVNIYTITKYKLPY